MPNGGMMPCCQVCQYATNLEKLGEVHCEQHDLKIHLSLGTFCADLSDEVSPGLANFINENGFQTGKLFQWIQIAYQDGKQPQLPQYYHEPAELISIEEYRTWTEQDAIRVSQQLHTQKRKELGME